MHFAVTEPEINAPPNTDEDKIGDVTNYEMPMRIGYTTAKDVALHTYIASTPLDGHRQR